MKWLALILILSGCVRGELQQVITPTDAIQLCGHAGVKQYSAIGGTVRCRR